MSLNRLKTDFETMLKLSRELGKLHEMLLHYSDMDDKRNYNEVRCKAIIEEIRKTQEVYDFLKNKWFDK